jgi:O-antigen ligase
MEKMTLARFWHGHLASCAAKNSHGITAGAAMNFLTTLLLVIVAGLGLILLVPLVGLALALALPVGLLFVWLLPMLIIACSDRTTGGEKLAWILAIVFLSWFAWIFYFLLAPIKQPPAYRRHYAYRPYRYD